MMLGKGMQMKKKLSVLLLGLVFAMLLFSTNSLAIQNDVSYENGQIISESDSIDEAYFTYTTEELTSLLGGITDNPSGSLEDELKKSKTITKFYGTFDQVPEYEQYREYYDDHLWGGFLLLTKAEKIIGGWEVTFSGYIYTLVE